MAPNNKQKKKQPKYSNPDPMSNVRDMGRHGLKMIRDIAKGNFNFYNDGHYFRNNDFTTATIEEVKRELYKANIHATAMQYTYANSSDPVVQKMIVDDMKAVEAYTLVYDTLMLVLGYGGDTRYLQILLTQLPRYRYNM